MLTNPTLDHMYTLGLSGMAAAWRELADQPEARAMEKAEWLGLMLDRKIAVRADKRLTARLAAAKLRFRKPVSKISTSMRPVISTVGRQWRWRRDCGSQTERI